MTNFIEKLKRPISKLEALGLLVILGVVLYALYPGAVSSIIEPPVIQIQNLITGQSLDPGGVADSPAAEASPSQAAEDPAAASGNPPVLQVAPFFMTWPDAVILGHVLSDSPGCYVSLNLIHLGSQVSAQVYGVTDSLGMYPASGDVAANRMPAPGYYDVWATINGQDSNRPRLTVEGIMVDTKTESYSIALGQPCTFEVYSSYTGSCTLVANNDAAAVSIPLGTLDINSGGYGSYIVGLHHLAPGAWWFNAVCGGSSAEAFGATDSIIISP